MEPIHSSKRSLQWKKVLFFTPRKKGSFRNCSLKGSLGTYNCFVYGIAVKPPFGAFIFKSVDIVRPTQEGMIFTGNYSIVINKINQSTNDCYSSDLARYNLLIDLNRLIREERWISSSHFIDQNAQCPPVNSFVVALTQKKRKH